MGQNFTSKDTSVNRNTKLPALYNRVTFKKGSTVVDYGCGNGTELIDAKAKKDGAELLTYDKYWKDDQDVLDRLDKGVDLSVCCNVLNVIDDVETIKEIIKRLCEHSKEVIFQIHEGDKSCKGRQTGKDQWQRNDYREFYELMIRSLGYKITRATGKFIYVKGVN